MEIIIKNTHTNIYIVRTMHRIHIIIENSDSFTQKNRQEIQLNDKKT